MQNGSQRKPMWTEKSPTGIQVQSFWLSTRSSAGSASRSVKSFTATAKLPPTTAVPSHPARGSPRRRPNTTSRANPNRGRAGTSQIRSIRSAPHQRDVVGIRALAPAQDRHDDRQADDDLGRG